MQITVKWVLEVGDTVKDKSNSVRFLVLCLSRILFEGGGGYGPQCFPGYAHDVVTCLLVKVAGSKCSS